MITHPLEPPPRGWVGSGASGSWCTPVHPREQPCTAGFRRFDNSSSGGGEGVHPSRPRLTIQHTHTHIPPSTCVCVGFPMNFPKGCTPAPMRHRGGSKATFAVNPWVHHPCTTLHRRVVDTIEIFFARDARCRVYCGHRVRPCS